MTPGRVQRNVTPPVSASSMEGGPPVARAVAGGRVYGPGIDRALADLQAILDRHIGASAGRCGICGGGPGICGPYVKASKAFAWSGHLPQRRPGATLAQVGSSAVFGWLSPSKS
jgi:hypothetical protein